MATVALYLVELVIGILLAMRALRREDERFFEAERIRIEQDRQPGSLWVAFDAWMEQHSSAVDTWMEQRSSADRPGGSGHDTTPAQH